MARRFKIKNTPTIYDVGTEPVQRTGIKRARTLEDLEASVMPRGQYSPKRRKVVPSPAPPATTTAATTTSTTDDIPFISTMDENYELDLPSTPAVLVPALDRPIEQTGMQEIQSLIDKDISKNRKKSKREKRRLAEKAEEAAAMSRPPGLKRRSKGIYNVPGRRRKPRFSIRSDLRQHLVELGSTFGVNSFQNVLPLFKDHNLDKTIITAASVIANTEGRDTVTEQDYRAAMAFLAAYEPNTENELDFGEIMTHHHKREQRRRPPEGYNIAWSNVIY